MKAVRDHEGHSALHFLVFPLCAPGFNKLRRPDSGKHLHLRLRGRAGGRNDGENNAPLGAKRMVQLPVEGGRRPGQARYPIVYSNWHCTPNLTAPWGVVGEGGWFPVAWTGRYSLPGSRSGGRGEQGCA